MHTNHGISKPVSLFCVVWQSLPTPSSHYPLTIAVTITHSAGLGSFCWSACLLLSRAGCAVLYLHVGSELLCPTTARAWPGAVLWKESLYNKHLWAVGFPRYLPLLCTHRRPQDTSLISVTYTFLNRKHYSYLCSSNTVLLRAVRKTDTHPLIF